MLLMLSLCTDDPPFNAAKVPWEAKEWKSGWHICIQSAAFQLDQPVCYITSWSPSLPSLILPHMDALRASHLLQFYCASPSFLYHSLYLWFPSWAEAFPLLSTHVTQVSVVQLQSGSYHQDLFSWYFSQNWIKTAPRRAVLDVESRLAAVKSELPKPIWYELDNIITGTVQVQITTGWGWGRKPANKESPVESQKEWWRVRRHRAVNHTQFTRFEKWAPSFSKECRTLGVSVFTCSQCDTLVGSFQLTAPVKILITAAAVVFSFT